MRVRWASVLVLGLIFGCGSRVMDYAAQEKRVEPGSDFTPFEGRAPSGVRNADSLILGEWFGFCVPHPLKASVYLKEIVQFDEGRVHRIQRIALDRTCAQMLYQQETEATTTLSSSGEYSETREGVTLLPLGAIGRELFNRGGVCGAKDWEASVPRSFDRASACGISDVVRGRFQIQIQDERPRLSLETCEGSSFRECYRMIYESRKSPTGLVRSDRSDLR